MGLADNPRARLVYRRRADGGVDLVRKRNRRGKVRTPLDRLLRDGRVDELKEIVTEATFRNDGVIVRVAHELGVVRQYVYQLYDRFGLWGACNQARRMAAARVATKHERARQELTKPAPKPRKPLQLGEDSPWERWRRRKALARGPG